MELQVKNSRGIRSVVVPDLLTEFIMEMGHHLALTIDPYRDSRISFSEIGKVLEYLSVSLKRNEEAFTAKILQQLHQKESAPWTGALTRSKLAKDNFHQKMLEVFELCEYAHSCRCDLFVLGQ